jgi:hypothetical protein
MIVLAIISTLAAIAWSFAVLWANSMRSSPGEFQFGFTLVAAWIGSAIMWLAWWFN